MTPPATLDACIAAIQALTKRVDAQATLIEGLETELKTVKRQAMETEDRLLRQIEALGEENSKLSADIAEKRGGGPTYQFYINAHGEPQVSP